MPLNPRAEYYLPDLAYIHHAGFSGFGEKAGRWIIRLLKSRGIGSGRIVELGCGSGVVTRLLVKHGYRVSAVDRSRAMISLARENCPEGRFSVGSLWSCALEPCRAVIAVGECLNYEFDGVNTSTKVRRLFSRIHDALLPDGVFVCDVLLKSRSGKPAKSQRFSVGRDWFVAVNRVETGRLITREIVHFRKRGALYRKGTEIHRQRKYSLTGIRSLLARTGFSVQCYDGYGKRDTGENHVVFVARKKHGPGVTV